MRVGIIGGGPAGAMAGVRLARAGVRVTIFDASHPREKPCGGGLTGRALGLVGDVLDIAALPAVTIRSAIVEDHDSTRRVQKDPPYVRIALPDSSLVVLSRAIFDKALLDAAVAAGAELVPEKVIAISRAAAAPAVQTATGAHACDIVIGADGANSLTRKTFARPFHRRELSIAAGYFVHGPQTRDIAIRSMTTQPGYLWSFPRPDHLAVGICAPADGGASSTDLRDQSKAWIASRGLEPEARLSPYAWPIPSVGFDSPDELRLAGPGWMLAGDAAGLVDPLTREGIYYAMLSGMWAADTIVARVAERQYAERVRDELYPELSRAARLSGLFFSPRFSSLFVSALRHSDPIRQVFADLVAGTQPYRGLRRRLLRTKEWRLAGRALQLVVQ